METNRRKWLAFDIETVKAAPESGDDYALGVTCAATMRSDHRHPLLWFGEIDEDDRYADRMTHHKVGALADYLTLCARDGFDIIGINSLGFDLRVLAEECNDPVVYDNLRDLALVHYDPAFQMLAERGFMVGMKALGIGLRLEEQKTADMDGQKAVEMWAGSRADQDKVLKYVAQDARTTLAIADALENKRWSWRGYHGTVYKDRRAIRWQTQKGAIAYHCLENGLLSVRECLALELPDVEWMKARGSEPWPRERFAGWALGGSDG